MAVNRKFLLKLFLTATSVLTVYSETPQEEEPAKVTWCGNRQLDWPWHVALFYRKPNVAINETFFCGGALVSTAVLITSADCFLKLKPRTKWQIGSKQKPEEVVGMSLYVAMGRRSLNSKHGRMVDKRIISVTIHPDRQIALVHTEGGFKAGEAKQPVCYNGNDMVYEDYRCWTVGWGLTTPSTAVSHVSLSEMELNVTAQSECLVIRDFDEDKHICVMPKNGDACMVDLGAGYFCKRQGYENWEFFGTKFDHGDCGLEPIAFTRLAATGEWVFTKW